MHSSANRELLHSRTVIVPGAQTLTLTLVPGNLNVPSTRARLRMPKEGDQRSHGMKIGFKLSVAVAACALTFGISSATAKAPGPCSVCEVQYIACEASGTDLSICTRNYMQCLRLNGCIIP